MAIVASPSPRVVRSFARSLPPVKPTRTAPVDPHPFGQGLFRSLPVFRATHSEADAAWHAAQTATADDRWIDALYAASVAADRVESGTCC